MLWPVFAVGLALVHISSGAMSDQERLQLRHESRDMFYHAYHAYMDNAYPADELMPLSCKGRFRGIEKNRGDIDDALGNFSLTLVDSLDTIMVFGDLDEFEHGVRLTIDNVQFDHDIIVSVFETNIRVVGGLLSAHILSEYVRDRHPPFLSWYKDELLNMALDLGYRLLPAFNSSTGLPHPRVNLRHGIKTGKIKAVGETCTACAGTMILEFAALSRLSGEPIFEEKASRAMDVLWSSRHRMSNLVGNVLNIHSGDWVRKDSGIGAGIDSYYEYVAKAYILLGEEKYLDRWQTHYAAIMKYLGQRPLMQDVHMHRPQTNAKHFVDALGAFWPGLQVLMGDFKPAIESHEILYQIMQRHNFIPEAFTTDYQVHWGQHLLRPEFVESTYFLFRATGDPYYLDVGKKVLKSLQKHARVPCGYATIKDVRTLQKEDRMDSFVLAETFKYLFLLFAEPSDLLLDIDKFVFTTEAHLLPLSLARLSNRTAVPLKNGHQFDGMDIDEDVEFFRSCPSPDFLFPNENKGHRSTKSGVNATSSAKAFADSLRLPLANVVIDKCPVSKVVKRKLFAADFQSGNLQHLKMTKDMGITIMSLPDGRVQLLHTRANAATPEDGDEGLLFMQEMVELSKQTVDMAQTLPKMVTYALKGMSEKVHLSAGPAQFGKMLEGDVSISAQIVLADPPTACDSVKNGHDMFGKIVLAHRGDCMFVEKARNLESFGAVGGIIVDNVLDSSFDTNPLFAMSGDGTDDVSIPTLFLFHKEGSRLVKAVKFDPLMQVIMHESKLESSSATVPDDPTPSLSFDFTAPVKSFLEKSRKHMQEYFGSNDQEEAKEDQASDRKSVIIHEDGRIFNALYKTVQGPNGEVRQEIAISEAINQDEDDFESMEFHDLSEEEAKRIIKQYSLDNLDSIKEVEVGNEGKEDEVVETNEDEFVPQILTDPPEDPPEEGYVPLHKYAGVLDALSPTNPGIEVLVEFVIKNGVETFLSMPNDLLIGVTVQNRWEQSRMSIDASFEMGVAVTYRLGKEEVATRVYQSISDYIREAVHIVNKALPGIEEQYREEVATDVAGASMRLQVFLDSKSIEGLEGVPLDGDLSVEDRREKLREYLLVYPVMFDAVERIKDDVRTKVKKDEL